MQKLILFLALLILAPLAGAADSPKDVQALISRGDYAGAEAMLRDAIAEHPQSAKAHYVLAEVLAHEGNIGEAKAEASKAATLDPGTHFTDPAKFQAFQRKLNEALAPAANVRTAAAPARYGETGQPSRNEGGSSNLLKILAIGAGIALIASLWMRRKRAEDGPSTGYPSAQPPVGTPPYGGYPGNGAYAPPPPPQAHSGVGTAVAAGLGGVAAGMLLDEALRSHSGGQVLPDTGSAVREDRDPSAQAYDDLRSDPIDMGNDDSSWDDSSSGDSGSSDDDSW
ncbi:tetratricopeptide repeat protein [Luteibacter yeojuensis]